MGGRGAGARGARAGGGQWGAARCARAAEGGEGRGARAVPPLPRRSEERPGGHVVRGEGSKELRGDGGGSLTHTAQDGRGAAAAPARLPALSPPLAPETPGERPRCRSRAPNRARHSVGSGASEGGEPGCRAGLPTVGQQWRRAAERCPRRSFAGRARGRPWPRAGRAGSSAPSSGARVPVSGLLFAG